MEIEKLMHSPIFLMPINVISLSLFVILQSEGYDVRGIFDNNHAAQGKQFRGVDISAPLITDRHNETIVICSYQSARGIYTQLVDMGVLNIIFFGDILSSKDANLLYSAFQKISVEELCSIAPVYTMLHKVSELRIVQSFLPDDVAASSHSLVIRSLNLMITERCSLRCRSCSSYMQYFNNPTEYHTDCVKNGLALLLNCVDYIQSISIVGGEPFLHYGLADITDFACNQDKVGAVRVFTNATIPADNALCTRLSKNNNLQIVISDYGELSKQKAEMCTQFERYKIPYIMQNEMIWYDHALLLSAMSKTEEEVQNTYRICNINCAVLAGTLFSKCQTALSMELLKAIPTNYRVLENSTIDLLANTSRASIAKHLESCVAMGACYVCSGKSRRADVKRIPPAIQTSKPLPYRRYEDAER